MSFTVYLGLGSNRGDRLARLTAGARGLMSLMEDIRWSSIYETMPREIADQPLFLNMAAAGKPASPELAGNPSAFLDAIHAVEAGQGRDRDRERPKGPRTLDIDILLWGGSLVDLPDLTIPHPALTEREFVLAPLLDLAPELTHPRTGEPLARRKKELDQGVYFYRSFSL